MYTRLELPHLIAEEPIFGEQHHQLQQEPFHLSRSEPIPDRLRQGAIVGKMLRESR